MVAKYGKGLDDVLNLKLPDPVPSQVEFERDQLEPRYKEELKKLRNLQQPVGPINPFEPRREMNEERQQYRDELKGMPRFPPPPPTPRNIPPSGGATAPTAPSVPPQDAAVARVRSLLRLNNKYPMQLNQVLSEQRPDPQRGRTVRGGLPKMLFEPGV